MENIILQDAADLPLQPQGENENNGDDETEEEEEVDVEEGAKAKRGKDKSWIQIGHFANNDQYKGSEIYTEMTAEMIRNNNYDAEEYQNDVFFCKFYKKRGWKSCPRRVRVGYSQTSSEIFVWEVEDSEHQHEEDPDFDTPVNFNWTAEQAEVVKRHLPSKFKRNNLILNELRANNLVNGAGKFPTLAQVGWITKM